MRYHELAARLAVLAVLEEIEECLASPGCDVAQLVKDLKRHCITALAEAGRELTGGAAR